MKKQPTTQTMPLDIGTIHFVGIGGIGMSGIAEILHNLGYVVQGSDLSENANVERLQKMGITVHIGQRAENVEGVAVVVKSSAVKYDNAEVKAAREGYIPVVRRAEMLAELTRLKKTVAIAGTHGKTTTTTMVTAMFEAANLDPTVINGGIINAYGTNARLGSGDWLVAEADESDGTFIALPTTAGVITNIDPEHLEHYGSFDNLKAAFRTFVSNLPFYGFVVMCKDHPEVKALIGQIKDRRILTYGIDAEEVDVKATHIRNTMGGSTFDVTLSERIAGKETTIKDLHLPMPGIHNVSNALAAIAVATELGMGTEVVQKALNEFEGVKRRFTKTGEVGGVTIIDDYAHHPKEIAATLKAAKEVVAEAGGRVIAVAQPHRYSRVKDLFDDFAACFSDADKVFVSEIFAAGEQPIEGVSQETMIKAIGNTGHADVSALESPEKLAETIAACSKSGDLVVCMGAGTVTYWANALPEQLQALASNGVRVGEVA